MKAPQNFLLEVDSYHVSSITEVPVFIFFLCSSIFVSIESTSNMVRRA